MLINFSRLSLSSLPSQFANFLTKQEKLKLAISILACGILLLGTAYWACSRFWNSRRVHQKDPSLQKGADSLLKFTEDKKARDAEELRQIEEERIKKEEEAKKLKEQLKQIKKEEEVEKLLEAKNAEKVQPISIPPSQTAIKASICITSSTINGWVGKELDIIPTIDRFKLENKEPLPLAKDDALLEFHCFNFPKELNLPGTIYLPAALFANKKEGDYIRLYYDNQLVEFGLHQTQHQLKYERGTFEEVLQNAKRACLLKDHPLFGKYIPYEWYQLDETTTLYKPRLLGPDTLKLEAVPEDQFRPLQKKAVVEKDDEKQTIKILEELTIDILRKDEGVYFISDLPGFNEKDSNTIDILLNEKVLGIHILRGSIVKELKIKGKDGQPLKFVTKPQEFIRGIKWKAIFKDLSLNQMQARLSKATLIIRDGVFQIFIPSK